MREIKFRVWDKKENEMFYSNMYQNKTSMIYGLCNFLKECFGIEEPIMQYTGLKDKNGMGLTEVYEGDIISIDGILKGSIYENNKEPTDIIIPQLGTKAWNDAYKEAVARGYDYSE